MSNGSNMFEIKIKQNGRLFSRHYRANSHKQAAKRVKGKGIIQSIRKVHSSDIIGTIKSMNLDDIIGIMPERRKLDVILDEVTLDSIVFPNISRSKRQKRREEHYKRQQDEQEV